MIDNDRIDRLEEKVDKLRADYSVLKYVIDKESLTDQLMKIFVNNASQQIPELIKLIEAVKTNSKKE